MQVDGFLQAIDAKTGNLVETFGNKGMVDMKDRHVASDGVRLRRRAQPRPGL